MAGKKKPISERGSFTKLYASTIRSPAYRALSRPARLLMWDMKACLNGTNNGTLTAPFSKMKKDFQMTSPTTLAKGLFELRALGFIAVTKQGGLKEGGRVCSTYRFTDLPTYDHPTKGIQAIGATFDFDEFKSISEARAILRVRMGEMQAKTPSRRTKKSPVQKMNRTDTETVLESHKSDTENVQGTPSTDTNNVHRLQVVK